MGKRMVRYKPRLHTAQQAGFSYLWLLFMVAFMSISLTIGSEVQSTITRRDQEKMLISIGRQFRDAIKSYHDSQVGTKREYPKSLNDLLKDPRFPNTKRHLRQIFIDPITGKDEWGLLIVGGQIVGVHSLSNKKPLKQDGFDTSEEKFAFKDHYTDWWFIAENAPSPNLTQDLNQLNAPIPKVYTPYAVEHVAM